MVLNIIIGVIIGAIIGFFGARYMFKNNYVKIHQSMKK